MTVENPEPAPVDQPHEGWQQLAHDVRENWDLEHPGVAALYESHVVPQLQGKGLGHLALTAEDKAAGRFLSKRYNLEQEVDQVGQGLDEEEAVTKRLSRELFGDFVQSFRLSQGETNLQNYIMGLLANRYRANYTEQMLVGVLSEDDPRVKRLAAPRQHKLMTEEDLSESANAGSDASGMWETYIGRIPYPIHYDDEKYRGPGSIETALFLMLGVELQYQQSGRKRQAEGDPYESIFRDCILGDNLIGSPQLLAVRDRLRHALTSPNPVYQNPAGIEARFGELKDKWEANHPGVAFDVVPDAARV